MDGKCPKSWLYMVLSGLKIYLNLMNISKKTTIKTAIKDIFLKLMFNILNKKINGLHNDLPFLPEILKIEKVEKLLANLHDKKEYVIHIQNLQQALNPKLVLKKVHRDIKFNQKAWLKSYINMNKAKKNAKGDLDFLQFHE